MNDDLVAAMTPEAMDALAKMKVLTQARRKNKRGPGGPDVRQPAARRLSPQSANELPALREAAEAMGFGGLRDMMNGLMP